MRLTHWPRKCLVTYIVIIWNGEKPRGALDRARRVDKTESAVHPKYRELEQKLGAQLAGFDASVRALPGVSAPANRTTLARQFAESCRKIDRTESFRKRAISPERGAPSSPRFDPEMAAVLAANSGDVENAFWLVFFSVHFGRHREDGWLLARQIYGAFGVEPYWTWARISGDPSSFRSWISDVIKAGTRTGRFGNHRKYETLDPKSPAGTASVFESYIEWTQKWGSHLGMLTEISAQANGDAERMFALLYRSMNAVRRFGRLGKFDYLTLLGKLGLAPISPDATYMAEATGPLKGARLLFTGNAAEALSAQELEEEVRRLDSILGIGMQAMEDGLCNWQKSPARFKPFRG